MRVSRVMTRGWGKTYRCKQIIASMCANNGAPDWEAAAGKPPEGNDTSGYALTVGGSHEVTRNVATLHDPRHRQNHKKVKQGSRQIKRSPKPLLCRISGLHGPLLLLANRGHLDALKYELCRSR
jgi:hypothetical protein